MGSLIQKKKTTPPLHDVIADTTNAASAPSSAPAASLLVALTGAGSTWWSVRMRPTRWLPSRRSVCHPKECGAHCPGGCARVGMTAWT